MTGSSWRFALFVILAGSLSGCEAADPLDHVRELQGEGRMQEALEPLRALLESHPDDAEIHYRYAVALRRTGQSGGAVWSLRKASEHPDWRVAAGLELAAASLEHQNWTSAIEAASDVLQADPESTQALYLRGEARLGEKRDLDGALADFDRSLEFDPDNVMIELSRLAALLLRKDVEEAASSIRRIEQLAQKAELNSGALAHLCVMKATFASESNEFEEAESHFGDCLDRYPTHGVVLREALQFFDARSRPDEANQLLRATLTRMPEALPYREMLATRLRAEGTPDASEALLRAGLELGGNALRADTWAALVNHFAAVDDLAAAADAYEQRIALLPDPSAFEILSLADYLARAGRHERALEVARTLDSDIYRGVVEARVHLNEGRPRQALDRLDSILPLWPNNAGARYYAARAAEQVGDFDRAIEEYRQAVRSEATLTDAGLRLAKLHAAQGSNDPAWEAASHHQRAHPSDPDGVAFLLELVGRVGPESRLRSLLVPLRQTPLWGRVVAQRADAVAQRAGSEAAIQLLRESKGIDYTLPRDAPALRVLAVHLIELSRAEEAMSQVNAALTEHPDEAAFHEIHGLVLQSVGASLEEVRAAYQRAVELDAKQSLALEALAGLAAGSGDTPAALALYDRATRASPGSLSAWRAAAQLATATGSRESAAERWGALLREHPWDASAALELARLHLAAGSELDRALELARRAIRFGGGPEAKRVLASVHRQRGEAELAAQILRDLEAAGPQT